MSMNESIQRLMHASIGYLLDWLGAGTGKLWWDVNNSPLQSVKDTQVVGYENESVIRVTIWHIRG